MMKPRYKDKALQGMYETMLTLAADPSSELYYNGEQRRGAGHRAAFWDGFSGKFEFSGPKRSAHVVPGTFSQACFMAGREWARRQRGGRAATDRVFAGVYPCGIVRAEIESDAAIIQAKKGELFEVSTCGQAVRLGGKS